MLKSYLLISILILLGLSCMPSQNTEQNKDTSYFERYPYSDETYFRNYFSNNLETLDPIEGIWTCSSTFVTRGVREDIPNYSRVAIIRDKNNYTRDFIEISLKGSDSEWDFLIGYITAHFSKASNSNFYISKQFGYDGSVDNMNFSFYDDGTFRAKGSRIINNGNQSFPQEYDQYYIKIYPGGNVAKNKEGNSSTGSGFLLSEKGYIVTNYHVIDGANKLDVFFPASNKTYNANVKIKDKGNDLAVLELLNFSYSDVSSSNIPYTLANSYDIKVGQESYSLGFPLGSILGTNASLSTGRITNLNGIEDNPKLLQINNNLQPGNSGGPLFNLSGELVGIVVSGLNAKYFYENAGIIPQNVNFAIKLDYLLPIISQLNIDNEIKNRTNTLSELKLEDQIEKVKFCIVQVNVK